MVYSAILQAQLPGDECGTDFIDSPFKEIGVGGGFAVEMQYVKMGMNNAVSKAFLRCEAYEALVKALAFLPKGYGFKILDAWRPFELQRELFYAYRQKIIKDFGLEDKNTDEQDSFVKRFVSLPNADVVHPPVHTTGGAVDLTVIDEEGNELPMGTDFDEFTDRTQTAFYEELIKGEMPSEISDNGTIARYLNNNKHYGELSDKEKQMQIVFNRRLLYTAMTKAGFTNLPSEWWHYDYYDRFYAYYTGTKARYKGAFALPDLTIE